MTRRETIWGGGNERRADAYLTGSRKPPQVASDAEEAERKEAEDAEFREFLKKQEQKRLQKEMG